MNCCCGNLPPDVPLQLRGWNVDCPLHGYPPGSVGRDQYDAGMTPDHIEAYWRPRLEQQLRDILSA